MEDVKKEIFTGLFKRYLNSGISLCSADGFIPAAKGVKLGTLKPLKKQFLGTLLTMRDIGKYTIEDDSQR